MNTNDNPDNWKKVEASSTLIGWIDIRSVCRKLELFGEYTVYYDGERNIHRLDGAAVSFSDGSHKWYFHGQQINCSNQKEFEQYLKLKAFW